MTDLRVLRWPAVALLCGAPVVVFAQCGSEVRLAPTGENLARCASHLSDRNASLESLVALQARRIETLELQINRNQEKVEKLENLTFPLHAQKLEREVRQRRDVCKYLRHEVKAGRLTHQDVATMDCK